MSTSFPGALDNFTTPAGSEKLGLSTPTHPQLHTDVNDAIEALEAVVGITGSTDPASIEKRLTDVINESATAAADAISAMAAAALVASDLATLDSSLGTASTQDVGTSAGNVVQLDGSARLPAVDGSQLTGLAPGGITDHGALTGLADDDHTQYHTDARGDARYEAIGAVSTHNAVSTAHGISSFGATLVDDADAATARATLGLGTAATTASTAYAVAAHATDTANPHAVTKAQVGLANADNTSDANKPVSTAQQNALNLKADIASPTFTGTVGGITAAMVGAPSGSGNSTGTNTGDSATPAETTTSIGSLINGATGKTTPVDADAFSIWDSVGGLLQKVTLANLKAVFNSLFVLLAGKSSGQTIIGGTGSGENLTLQSTSHATRGKILLGSASAYDEVNDRLGIGTTSQSAKIQARSTTEQLRLEYDASNSLSATVSSAGVPTLSSTSGQYTFKGGTGTAALGSELVTNGSFTTNLSGWTDSGATWGWSAGTALHTAGSASTLSQSVSVTSGTTYQLEFTMAGRTAGSVTITLGAVTANSGGTTAFTSSTKVSLVAAASGAVTLSIIPTSDFNGSLDDVTVKSVGVNAPTLTLLNNSSSTVSELRANANYDNAFGSFTQYALTTGNYDNAFGHQAQYSLTTGSYDNAFGSFTQYALTTGNYDNAFGHQAQRFLTTGIYDNAFGIYAQFGLTTGSYDNAFGGSTQYALTTGSYDNAFGHLAQRFLTTGNYDNAFGIYAQYSLTTGSNNNALGGFAQYSLTTGGNNNSFGYNAQRYLADGTTAATVFDYCTHIGDSTRVSANSVTNETVVGANAIGLGSNTCAIGSSAVTKTKIFGTPIFMPVASSVPTVNGELTVEATSNTSLTFRLKGTDGTVRSASLTLT